MATMTATPTGHRTVTVPVTEQAIAAPQVQFVTERPRLWAGLDENGRRLWLSIEEHAHNLTGRSRATGQYTIGVAVRRRRNGLTRFDGDLWKLPWNLSPAAISGLYRHWHDLNAGTPKQMKSRMERHRHFSRNTIIFDAVAEQVDAWREFLTLLLTDHASYVSIKRVHGEVTS